MQRLPLSTAVSLVRGHPSVIAFSMGMFWTNAPPQEKPCTLIYDGDCRFCVKSTESFQRLSSSSPSASVRYIPYRSVEAESLLGSEYRSGRPDVAYLVGSDGQVHKGLDAMLPLLVSLPGGRLITSFVAIPGCRLIALWLYRLVAQHRYWFGVMPTDRQ